MRSLENHMYKVEPEASSWIEQEVALLCAQAPFARALQHDLLEKTSTNLFDWLDFIQLPHVDQAEKLGFQVDAGEIYRHPRAQLPGVKKGEAALFIAVDSIADFLMVRGIMRPIDGPRLGSFRSCLIADENGVKVFVVERRAYPVVDPGVGKMMQSYELWKTRTRTGDEGEAWQCAFSRAQVLVELLGKPMAATVVMDVERQFWMAKNRAGQVQRARQDHLGMGWANHDHHTFRASRRNFSETIRLFELLGFRCRERFYAGREAGWGAQVMEHPDIRLVLFIDVDLSPDELLLDFAHLPLPPRETLGTIGLWCALHGESILQAGMHHLEAQFSFEKLTEDLKSYDVKVMAPFSNFAYLKQAFTVGERWKVDPDRIEKLLQEKLITEAQAAQFRLEGALGSHLENLERHDGFKGFNQKAVSDIIHRTDPRGNLGA